MSLDKLSKYRVNKAFTEGVDIHLDDAPDVCFRVKLPGQYNRAYMAEMYGSIEVDFNEAGEAKTKTNILKARDTQELAFIKHCLVSIDGEPAPDNFASDFPLALEELLLKSNKLLEGLDKAVDEGSKKSQPSLVGSTSGATG